MIIELTWPQLRRLEELIRCLAHATLTPKGELKDGEGALILEWDETEVKFNLSEE